MRTRTKFNKELYLKYKAKAGIIKKDGIWDVTEYKNGLYCFATKQKLGNHGEVEDHDFQEDYLRIRDNKLFKLKKVCIHWAELGYYYYGVLVDENGSSVPLHLKNINCTNLDVLKYIFEFNQKYLPV